MARISSTEIWSWKVNESRFTRVFIFGNYNDSIAAYMSLVEKANKDFPSIAQDDMTTGKVRNSGCRDGYICISFLVPNDTRKKGYRYTDVKKGSMDWTY